jgi:hypothetical protein
MKANEGENKLAKRLHEQLQETEAWADGETPQLEWFEHLIATHQHQHRLLRKRELLLFLFVACWIVSGLLLMMALQPRWFIVLQGMLMLAFTLPFLQTYLTRKKLGPDEQSTS